MLPDVAFLAMDLQDLGRPDLAAQFLRDDVELSGHPHSRSLADHDMTYRALVRSKVTFLRGAQGDATAAPAAQQLAALCLRRLEASAVRLVLVVGLPGTGTSTLTAALADRSGWTVLRSDALRKELLGRRWGEVSTDAFGEGANDDDATEQTYRRHRPAGRHRQRPLRRRRGRRPPHGGGLRRMAGRHRGRHRPTARGRGAARRSRRRPLGGRRVGPPDLRPWSRDRWLTSIGR